MMESLQYRPLRAGPHDDTIRVLDLLPGARGLDIRCELRYVMLSSNPSYEALSYCWHPKNPKRRIICCETEVDIGENLYLALRHLRHETERRTLWADAICINQEDDEEKSCQVRMMSSIYGKAAGVV